MVRMADGTGPASRSRHLSGGPSGRSEVRDGGLHEARHTAATALLTLCVPERVVMQITDREPGTTAQMRARYLQMPDAMLKDVARKLADAIWGPSDKRPVDKDQDKES